MALDDTSSPTLSDFLPPHRCFAQLNNCLDSLLVIILNPNPLTPDVNCRQFAHHILIRLVSAGVRYTRRRASQRTRAHLQISKTALTSHCRAMSITRDDVEVWCDSHPFEFDMLVATKATSEGVKQWHENNVTAHHNGRRLTEPPEHHITSKLAWSGYPFPTFSHLLSFVWHLLLLNVHCAI